MERMSVKNEISLELIMNQVDIEIEMLKKELSQRYITKDNMDSNEYQSKRKVGDIERLLNQTRDELTHQKNLL